MTSKAGRLAGGLALLGVLFVGGSAGAARPPAVSGWLVFGGGVERSGSVARTTPLPRTAWFAGPPGMITTQPLVARNVPARGTVTVYVETSAGSVYALAANGYVRWRVDLGQLRNDCPQIPDGWGVTGTPVIDPATHALYVVDAFGRLHALDLATGRERPGWPVVLYQDFRKELDWGALTLVDGSVYVPTGSFCDRSPMEGKLIRVVLSSRRVSSWVSVPLSLGGGGSVWGWGGAAYSNRRNSIYVGTGNAFEGGTNTGQEFSEQAGYGEQLVQLSRSLTVLAASKPQLGDFPDNGFVGSPVIANRPGCEELVVAQTKSGTLFGWRSGAVAAGPVWRVQVQPSDPATPLLTQPAYAPALRSLFVVTWGSLLRVQLDAGCRPSIAWTLPLGQRTLEGSPAVTGQTVWVPLSGARTSLLAVNAGSGRLRARIPVGGVSFTPPVPFGRALYMGSTHGFSSRAFPVAKGRPASALPEHASAPDSRHRWQSREDGVYASNDGGRRWQRIYPNYATRVVHTSATAGLISVGFPASACNCATRQLSTNDGGRTWHSAPGIGPSFEGRGSSLYWWQAAALYRVTTWPPRAGTLRSRRIETANGTIVDAANVPAGIAALVDRRRKPPQVILAAGLAATTVTLPDGGDDVIPSTIAAAWPALVVRGTDYSHPTAAPDPSVTWRSSDGGKTWTLNR